MISYRNINSDHSIQKFDGALSPFLTVVKKQILRLREDFPSRYKYQGKDLDTFESLWRLLKVTELIVDKMEEVLQGPKADLFIELNKKLDEISASLQRHQMDKTKPSLNAAAICLLEQQQNFIQTLAGLPVTSESKEKIKTLKKQMIDISIASIHHARNQGEVILAKQMKELLALLKRVTDAMSVTDKKTRICRNHGSEESLWRRLVETPQDRSASDVSSTTGDRVASLESRPNDDVRSMISRQRDPSNEEGKKERKRNRLRKLRMRIPPVFPGMTETPTPAREKSSITQVNSQSIGMESNQGSFHKYGSDKLSMDQSIEQATPVTDSSMASELSQDTENCAEQELFPDDVGCVNAVPALEIKRDPILSDIADSEMVSDMTSSASVLESISGQDMIQRQEGSNVSGYISPVQTEESIPSNVFDGVDIQLTPSDCSLHSFASFYSDYTHHDEENSRTRSRFATKSTDDREQNGLSSAAISFAPDKSFGDSEIEQNQGDAIKRVSSSLLPDKQDVQHSKAMEMSRGSQNRCDALKSMTLFSLVAVAALILCLYLKASGVTAVLDYYSWWEVLYKHIDVTKIADSLF